MSCKQTKLLGKTNQISITLRGMLPFNFTIRLCKPSLSLIIWSCNWWEMYLTLEFREPIWIPGEGSGTLRARRGSWEAQVTVRRAGGTAGRTRTRRAHYVPLGKPWRTDSRSPKRTVE